MEERIAWKEGLLLTPQHFQQNDRYFMHELVTRCQEDRPNNWGFFRIDINRQHFAMGRIVVDYATGVMPDGTLFDVDGKNYNLALDVQEHDVGKVVYLALPMVIKGSVEVQNKEQVDFTARNMIKPLSNVSNTVAGEVTSQDILGTQLNFFLRFEEQLNDSFIRMSICRIRDVSTGGIVKLDDDFEPTYRHFNASSPLTGNLIEITNMISYRSEQIANRIFGSTTVKTAELGDYLMLQLLNRMDARLRFYISQDRVHPMDVFLELSGFAGELAAFTKESKRMSSYLEYNHKDQKQCFEQLVVEVRSMLSMVLEQASISFPMEKRKFNIMVTKINDKRLIEYSTFILMVTADSNVKELSSKLPPRLKVGTVETIRNLVNLNLQGFQVEHLASAPRQIPSNMDYSYFKLDLTKENKHDLQQSGGFAFHVSGEFPGLEMKLWAIRNQ